MTLSEPATNDLAATVVLRDSAGREHTPVLPTYQSETKTLTFPGPFPSDTTLTAHVPDAFRDIKGRPFTKIPAAQQPIRIGHLPPYAGMMREYGILAWKPGKVASWPLSVRGSTVALAARRWHFGADVPSEVLLALHAQNVTTPNPWAETQAIPQPVMENAYQHSEAILKNVHAPVPAPREEQLAFPGDEARLVNLDLSGYGSWLLQSDSPAIRAAYLRQQQELARRKAEPATVVLTRLRRRALAWNGTEITREGEFERRLRALSAEHPSKAPLVRLAGTGFEYGEEDALAELAESEGVRVVNDRELNKVAAALENSWQHSRSSVVQLTNLNVHTTLSPRGDSLVWVTAFDSGLPVANAHVEIWDGNAAPFRRVIEANSDAQGRVPLPLQSLPGPLNEAMRSAMRASTAYPLWVVVRRDQDLAVMRALVNDRSSYDSGESIHTVLDRRLYHAGETVSMAFTFRVPVLAGWAVPPSRPTTLRIVYGYYGEKLYEQELAWNADGTALASWSIPAEARLGQYSYELLAEHGYRRGAHGTFQVEEFKVPVFDANLDLSTTWRGARQTLHVAPSLSFVAGGAAAGQSTSISGKYTVGADSPVPEYNFFNQELRWSDEFQLPATVLKLDRDGRAHLNVPPPATESPLTLFAEMQFADPSGETQVHGAGVAIWPERHKLGIALATASASDKSHLALLALDENNAPLRGKLITVDAALLPASREGRISIPDADRKPVCTVATAADGKARCAIPWSELPGPGAWIFRARAEGASTATNIRYGKEDGQTRPQAVLERIAAEPAFPGDDEHLRVRAPFLPATLLLTVEREGVLASQTHLLTQSEEDIALPTRAEFAPGVTVVATFVGAMPVFSGPGAPPAVNEQRARLDLMLNQASRRLQVELQAASKDARPGTRLSVAIKVRQPGGTKPAAGTSVTLIAVDDALALLKPNTTTAIGDSFWLQRGTDSSDHGLSEFWQINPAIGPQPQYTPHSEAIIALFGSVNGTDGYFWEKRKRNSRRDAEGMNRAQAAAPVAELVRAGGLIPAPTPRINFSTLALWEGHLLLDEKGEGTVSVPLPDSLTRWRIIAVASAGTDLFGTGETVISTSKPVEVLSGLALSVRGADRVEQKLTVRNTTGKRLSLLLLARATPIAHPDQAASPQQLAVPSLSRRLDLAPKSNSEVRWPVVIPDGIVGLDWKISAQDRDTGEVLDALDIQQKAVLQAPLTVRESTLVAVPGTQRLNIARPSGSLPGIGAISVHWEASQASSAIDGARAWAASYPNTCMEQRSSIAAISGSKTAWRDVVASLPRHKDGGLLRFFPETKGSELLTAYVLTLAEHYKLPLPQEETQKMRAALREVLARPASAPTKDWLDEREVLSFRLAVQAAMKGELGGAAPTEPADLDALPTEALIDWASYLLDATGLPEREVKLQQAAVQLRNRYTVHGGHLAWRDDTGPAQWRLLWSHDALSARAALLLQRWQLHNPIWTDELVLLPRAIADAQRHGSWQTTVGNALSVAALQHLLKEGEQGPVTGVSTASLAGQVRTATWPSAAAAQLPLPVMGSAPLVLEHRGTGAPWASINLLAANKGRAAVSHGLAVSKTTSAVEQRVPGRWSVGDVIKVRLDIRSDSDLGWLVVHDPIPSGASILGKGLGREGQLVQKAAKLQGWWTPSAVERASDSFRAYYERVWQGEWHTEYLVRLNNAGSFGLPATRIEAMYAPEIYGESPNDKLEVQP
ncbi:MAG: MG2 domain-containing protein [Massilia sp.]